MKTYTEKIEELCDLGEEIYKDVREAKDCHNGFMQMRERDAYLREALMRTNMMIALLKSMA